MDAIVDRMARCKEKQRRWKMIALHVGHPKWIPNRRARAEAAFLHWYAGWSYAKIARYAGVSSSLPRVWIKLAEKALRPTVCHPKGSCR